MSADDTVRFDRRSVAVWARMADVDAAAAQASLDEAREALGRASVRLVRVVSSSRRAA